MKNPSLPEEITRPFHKKPQIEIPSLPEELLIEIFSRLPLKSVGRCRCLSKSWRTNLSTSQFLKLLHTPGSKSHLFQSETGLHTFNLDGDGTVVPRKLDIPAEFNRVAGSCNGLVLLSGRKELLVVNPFTLEQVRIKRKPPLADHYIVYGFGYDSCSDDYKIVKLTMSNTRGLTELGTFVDVYSLKKGAWKRINDNRYPWFHPPPNYYGVFVNGAIHWLAWPWPRCSATANVIVAFDVASESFCNIRIPYVTRNSRIFENAGCLLMVCNGDIWMMKKYGQENSWTKFRRSVTFEDWRELTPLFLFGENEVVLSRDRGLSMWAIINGTTKDLIVDGALDRRDLIIDGVTYVESLDSPVQYCIQN